MTKKGESPVLVDWDDFATCKYPAAIGHEILGRMASGESLRSISSDEHMPALGQITWWLQGVVKGGAAGVIGQHYAQARAARADAIGDTVAFLIDDQASLEPTRRHQNARVAMDGARWMLGRMNSKNWSEQVQHEHRGHLTLSALLSEARQHTTAKPGGILDHARSRVIEGETVDKSGDSGDK